MKIKKSLLILFVFSLAFSLAAVFQISKTKAGIGNGGTGWLWGGSDDGAGNNTGLGWLSLNNTNTGGATDYGVNIPSADGNLSGYAWSSNSGWIDFAPAGPYPASPNNSAMRVGNNLKGWARIVSLPQAGVNAGGWDGWIKLGSETGDPITYGITLNADGTITKGSNTSYAWSKELGWIDFSKASIVDNGCAATICSNETCYNNITTVWGNITPTYNYSCTSTTTASCALATCGETITTAVKECVQISNNGCDKENGFVNESNCTGGCPDVQETCPACPVKSGNWKEVAP